MNSVSFHRLATLELNAAARYYDGESPGLGTRFLDAAERCVHGIVEFPDSGTIFGATYGESSSTGSLSGSCTGERLTEFGFSPS